MKIDHFSENKGKLEELDRSFDLEFWQSQPPKQRFNAAWALIVHAWKVKGREIGELRLDRTVERFGRQQRYAIGQTEKS